MHTAELRELVKELRQLSGADDLINLKFLVDHRPAFDGGNVERKILILKELIAWMKVDEAEESEPLS